jgi:hypothetical protein
MSRHDVFLTGASLLAILFLTFHLADDVVRGFEPAGFKKRHRGGSPERTR